MAANKCKFGIKMKLNRDDNFKLVILAAVSIASDIITIMSFGTVITHWRADVLFFEWYDESMGSKSTFAWFRKTKPWRR